MKKYQKGFTIIEVLVVAPIVLLTVGIIVTVIINMTGQVMVTRAANQMSYETQDALVRIEQDVQLSGAFLATNNFPVVSPQGSDDGTATWENANNENPVLILNYYATTLDPASTDSSYVYVAGQPNSCSSQLVSQNTKMVFNIIYFVKDGSLWRRVVAPETYSSAGCATPWQQPTCSPSESSEFCAGKDVELVKNLSEDGFLVEYFEDIADESPNSTASNPAASQEDRTEALTTTPNVKVTISTTRTVAGKSFSNTGSILATSSNNDAEAPNLGGLANTHDYSLIGWWPLNGNANDFSGNDNNGTVSGATLTTGQNGQSNSAYSFNGTSSRIDLPNAALLTFGTGAGKQMTISLWFKASGSSTSFQSIFSRRDSSSGDTDYSIYTQSGNLAFGTGTSADSCAWLNSTPEPTRGTWHNISATISQTGSTSGSKQIWVNGVLAHTCTYSSKGAGSSQPRMGSANTSPGAFFNGEIDDIRLYNRALSDSEIQALYSNGAS